jgi:hypothetical protein
MEYSAESNRLYSHPDAPDPLSCGDYQASQNNQVVAAPFPDKRRFFAVKTLPPHAVKTLLPNAVRTFTVIHSEA